MKIYQEFPPALRKVIATTQGGNQSDFAAATGLAAASISRLCAGTREITRDTLEKLTRHLPEAERRRLYLAALLDFLPDEGREMFFPNRKEEFLIKKEDVTEYSVVDPETRRILDWINRQTERQEEVRVWLRTLAKWIGPNME